MSSQVKNLYRVLGVQPTVTDAEIKVAFRNLAKTFHPDTTTMADKSAAADKFKQLNEAFTTLSKNRSEYDRQYESVFGPIRGGGAGGASQSNPFARGFAGPNGRANYQEFYGDFDSEDEFDEWEDGDPNDFFRQYERAQSHARMRNQKNKPNHRNGNTGGFHRTGGNKWGSMSEEDYENVWRDFSSRFKDSNQKNFWRNAGGQDGGYDDRERTARKGGQDYYDEARSSSNSSKFEGKSRREGKGWGDKAESEGGAERMNANREDEEGRSYRKMGNNGPTGKKRTEKEPTGGASHVWVLASRRVGPTSHLHPPVLDVRNKTQQNRVEKPFFFTKKDVFEWLSERGDRRRIYSVYKNANFEHTVQWEPKRQEWIKPFSVFNGKKGGHERKEEYSNDKKDADQKDNKTPPEDQKSGSGGASKSSHKNSGYKSSKYENAKGESEEQKPSSGEENFAQGPRFDFNAKRDDI